MERSYFLLIIHNLELGCLFLSNQNDSGCFETNTRQKWLVYETPLYNKDGFEIPNKLGKPYDAHHIIQNSHGGPNEWWNIHPAHYKAEHPKIHGAGPAREIFYEPAPAASKEKGDK